MLAIERRSRILENLQNNQSVLVSELSKEYNVTEETIRRDLEKLEREGLVKKTYGGAVFTQNTNADMPFKLRERARKEEKLMIARKVAEYIEDGDSLMLDSSSTVLTIARALKQKKNLRIITNSVEILLEFADIKSFQVISTGGTLREASLSLVGPEALRLLRGFNVDKSIISCKGMDLKKGFTESNQWEVDVKMTMAASAKQLILAADFSKLNKISFARLMDLDMPDVIALDRPLEGEWKHFYQQSKVKVL